MKISARSIHFQYRSCSICHLGFKILDLWSGPKRSRFINKHPVTMYKCILGGFLNTQITYFYKNCYFLNRGGTLWRIETKLTNSMLRSLWLCFIFLLGEGGSSREMRHKLHHGSTLIFFMNNMWLHLNVIFIFIISAAKMKISARPIHL